MAGVTEGFRERSNLCYEVASSTVANILKEHGMEPAPERSWKTTWKEFLARHWEVIVAAGCFTIEAWTRKGLTRFVVVFLMDLSTRKMELAGVAAQANGLWMSQITQNLHDAEDGFMKGKRHLIHDRDPLFTENLWRPSEQLVCNPRNCYRGRRI